jgi:thiol-disulfide isomerase/thioredoxin
MTPKRTPRSNSPRTSTPSSSAARQQHGQVRRTLLVTLGLGAAAAGAWFGLRGHDPADGRDGLGSEATGGAATGSAAAGSAAADAASPPLVASDVVQAGFWAQQFDTPAGGTLSLASLKGKPVLLNFWATWCPPCVKEMPELDRFQKEFAHESWQVLGLAIDGPTPVKEFLAKVPVGFGIGLAGFGGTELAQALGNATGGLPFSLLIDAQGRVRHRKMGATNFEELASWARAITP